MTTTFARAARRAALTATLALGGALLAPGGGAAPARAATLIQSCPYAILAPGTYVLDRDLTCPGVDAITVTADGVRLVLGGRTLTGDRGGDFEHYGVVARGTGGNPAVEGLRVEGGTVRYFRDGVHLEDAPGARVAGVTAARNFEEGIEVAASWGARVVGNTASGNQYGIYLNGCDGYVAAGNRAAGSDFEGILVGGTGNRIAGNTVTGSGFAGIRAAEGATGNRIEGNAVAGGPFAVDLWDDNLPACVNTWRGNRFAADNEDDGPGAGCIR